VSIVYHGDLEHAPMYTIDTKYHSGKNFMKNNDKVKKQVDKIGFGRTLQCLIEIVDDSINGHTTAPLWKLTLAENLENAYDAFMNRGHDILCDVNND